MADPVLVNLNTFSDEWLQAQIPYASGVFDPTNSSGQGLKDVLIALSDPNNPLSQEFDLLYFTDQQAIDFAARYSIVETSNQHFSSTGDDEPDGFQAVVLWDNVLQTQVIVPAGVTSLSELINAPANTQIFGFDALQYQWYRKYVDHLRTDNIIGLSNIQLVGHSDAHQFNVVLLADYDLNPAIDVDGLFGFVTGFGGLGVNFDNIISVLSLNGSFDFDNVAIIEHFQDEVNDPTSTLFSNVFNLHFGVELPPKLFDQVGLQLFYAGGYSFDILSLDLSSDPLFEARIKGSVTSLGQALDHTGRNITRAFTIAANNSQGGNWTPPLFDWTQLGLPPGAFSGELTLTGPATNLLSSGNVTLGSNFDSSFFFDNSLSLGTIPNSNPKFLGVSFSQVDPVTGVVNTQSLNFVQNNPDSFQLTGLNTFSFDDATGTGTFKGFDISADEIAALNAEQVALGQEIGAFDPIPLVEGTMVWDGLTSFPVEAEFTIGNDVFQGEVAAQLAVWAQNFLKVPQFGLDILAQEGVKEYLEGGDPSLNAFVERGPNGGIVFYVLDENDERVKELTLVEGSSGLMDTLFEKTVSGDITIIETFNKDTGHIETEVIVGSGKIPLQSVGSIIGSQLGKSLAGDNAVAQVAAGAAFGTVVFNFGEVVDQIFYGDNISLGDAFDTAFKDLGSELQAEFANAARGAISAYLVAELIDVLGIGGVAADLLNTTGGAVINQIFTNITDGLSATTAFSGVNPALLGNAVASYLGAKLASEIRTPNTQAGQLGAAIGSAVGGLAAGIIVGSLITTTVPVTFGAITTVAVNTAVSTVSATLGVILPVVGILIGALLGHLLGGLIGDLFGTTPETGADLEYDPLTGEFSIGSVFAEGGASRDLSRAMAGQAGDILENIVKLIGGSIMEESNLDPGTFGMYSSSFSFWEGDSSGVRHDFDDFGEALDFGVYDTLNDFLIEGGDTYIKRAFYSDLDNAYDAQGNFIGGMDVLLGDIRVGQDYSFYLQNENAINALMAAEPDSAFTAGWIITLQRALELNLNKRHVSDWYGGWELFEEALNTTAGNISMLVLGKERHFLVTDNDGQVSLIGDTIDSQAKDIITGTIGNDVITVNGDVLQGNAAFDINGVTGSATNFTIDVAAQIFGGDGNDTITGGDLGNELYGEDGDDTLTGGRNADWLFGGLGNDTLNAGFGDGNYLDGGAGNDDLNGSSGSDWLEGGDGIDTLTGGAGGDIIASGAGNETQIFGGAGDDQYIFRLGDGVDVIFDQSATTVTSSKTLTQTVLDRESGVEAAVWTRGAVTVEGTSVLEGAEANGGLDSIVFGPNIKMEDIRITRPAGTDDLFIEIYQNAVATGDTLTVTNWFSDFNKIEKLVFSDGQVIDISNTVSFVVGTEGPDVLLGTNGNDFIVGAGGNDTIFLFDGDDFGAGSEGDDFISGDVGNDLLVGGDGEDAISGAAGNDTIVGGRGDDQILGVNGNDVIAGDEGNDTIFAGSGDDIIKFGYGDDHDTVYDVSGGWGTIWDGNLGGFQGNWGRDGNTIVDLVTGQEIYDGNKWLVPVFYNNDPSAGINRVRVAANGVSAGDTSGSTDRIEFDLGVDIHDIYFEWNGNDLVIGLAPNGADVNFADISDTITMPGFGILKGIEELAFFNVGAINLDDITDFGGGTDGDDTINGSTGRDWLTGHGGNDTIDGNAGDDLIVGQGGSDTLYGDLGDDVILGGSGNDILEGGDGTDILVGGSGFDTVSFEHSGAGVKVHLNQVFHNLQFPVTSVDPDQLIEIEGVIGSAHNDGIWGNAGANQFEGGKGNDQISGGAGDDVYIFNVGDGVDTITDAIISFVPESFETYVDANFDPVSPYQETAPVWFDVIDATPPAEGIIGKIYYYTIIDTRTGDTVFYAEYDVLTGQSTDPGDNTLKNKEWFINVDLVNGAYGKISFARELIGFSSDAGNDTLILGDGFGLSDVSFSFNGADLIVGLPGADQITIDNFTNSFAAIETLAFSNGVSVDLTGITLDGTSTAGDDFMVGTAGADIFDAQDGNDTISGMAGDDILSGGLGDDQISGGAGADTIDGGAGLDTAIYTGSTLGVTIDLGLGTGLGGDAAGDTLTGIENVIGSDAGDNITGDANNNQLIGNGGGDTLTGLGGDDVLIGGEGNDILSGGLGDDDIDGGTGGDTLDGGDGHDMLNAGDGDDTLIGGLGDDWLIGGAGIDSLDGGAGLDKLIGGDGVDTLTGGAGDDELTGGTGNDILAGGTGADAYVFSLNSGVDTLTDDNLDENIIVFDNTVSHEQLWFSQSVSNPNDLIIQVVGGDTNITVQNWFLDTSNPPIKTIHTLTGSIHFSFVQNMVDAMSGQGLPATVADIPQTALDAAATYFYQGENPAPSADDAVLIVDENNEPATTNSVNGQVANVLDLDDNLLVLGLYSVQTQPGNGTVTINADTGAYTYTPDTFFEGTDTFQIGIEDADGSIGLSTVSVTVNPIATSPQDVTSLPSSFDENGSQLLVGTLSGNDPDFDDSHTFEIMTGLDGAEFAVIGSQLWFVGNARNFEVDMPLSLNIRATDSTGLFVDKVVNVSINDVGESPTGLAFTGNVAEAAAAGTAVGTASATDVDGGATITYSLAFDGDGAFTIDPNTGAVTVAAGGIVDFEGGNNHITIVATGSGGGVSRETFNITVTDANDAPIAIDFAGGLVDGSTGGAVVGTAASIDEDAGDTHTYSLTDDALGTFVINATTGEVSVAAGKTLNLTTTPTYNITIRTTDQNGLGLFHEQIFTLAETQAPASTSIDGTAGADTLNGTANGDSIFGFAGNDTINGNDGDDFIVGGAGGDVIDGGLGADTISFDDAAAAVQIQLWEDDDPGQTATGGDAAGDYYLGIENVIGSDFNDAIGGNHTTTLTDKLAGGLGNDTLEGWDGDDVLSGGDGADFMNGVRGDDLLFGGGGNDQLRGGANTDLLFGGVGNDILRGQAGTDTYYFSKNSGADTIYDTQWDVNTIQFDSTVSFNDLWFTDLGGGEVKIQVIGGDTEIIINNGLTQDIITTIKTLDGNLDISNFQTLVNAMAGHTLPASVASIPTSVQTAIDANWTVVNVNTPKADDAFLQVTENHDLLASNSVSGQVSGVTDANNNVLATGAYSIQMGPSFGTLTLDSDTGAYTYTPDLNYSGDDLFQIGITDATGNVGLSYVYVDVDPLPFNAAPSTPPPPPPPTNGVNFAPLTLDFNGAAVNEDEAVGFVVGTASATDPNSADTLTFSLVDDAGGLFAINGTTGVVTVNGPLDFETLSSHTITIRVTDDGGLTKDRSFPIFLNEVGEAPNAINFVGSLDENTPAEVNVGILIANDDEGGVFTYSLISDPSGKFAIDLSSGVVSTTAGASFDFETTSFYDITIKATDSLGNIRQEVIRLNVGNINEAVTAVNFSGTAIDENLPAGTVVGTASAVDLDTADTHTFSITNDLSGFFTIDPGTGIVTLATGVDLDYETAISHDITIRATDQGGLFFEQGFTINVNDINETNTPPTISDATFSIVENAPFNTPVGTVLASDIDDPLTPEGDISFSITGGNSLNKFFIDEETGEIRVNGGLNFEADPLVYTLTVQVKDFDDLVGQGLSDTATVTINMTNQNETPTGSNKSITKNDSFIEGLIVNLNASDPDGDSLTYTINSVTGTVGVVSDFSMVGGALHSNGNLNHRFIEKTSIVSINISDGFLSINRNVTITWLPQDEPNFPVVFDLDGDGIELISIEDSTIEFDVNGDGFLDRIGWVAPDDGFLALDRNGDGIVTDGTEISFIADLPGAETDFEGLVAFDTNGDGVLDAQDQQFAEFLIWQDLNQNGFSEQNELKTLAEAGIASIDLTLTPTGATVEGATDNVILNTANYTLTNGTVLTAGDVALLFIDGAPGQSGGHRKDLTHGNFDTFIAAQVAANGGGGVLPVVIDLDGDGLELIGLSESTIFFDTDNDGLLEKIGWVAADDGILAYDANNNGIVDALGEITFADFVEGATTDLEGLLFFDTNNDLIFNAEDEEFSSFGIWQDLNQNGVSDPGEFFTLDEMGILRINLDFEAAGTTSDGNTIHNVTSFTYTDFTGGLVGDVELGVEDTNLPVGIQNAIDELDDIPGGGGPGTLRAIERLQTRLARLEARFGNLGGIGGFKGIFGQLNSIRENFDFAGNDLQGLQNDLTAIGNNLQGVLETLNNHGFGNSNLDNRFQNLIQAMGAFGAGRGGGELDLQERMNMHFGGGNDLALPHG